MCVAFFEENNLQPPPLRSSQKMGPTVPSVQGLCRGDKSLCCNYVLLTPCSWLEKPQTCTHMCCTHSAVDRQCLSFLQGKSFPCSCFILYCLSGSTVWACSTSNFVYYSNVNTTVEVCLIDQELIDLGGIMRTS